MPSPERPAPSPAEPARRQPDVLARLEQAVGQIQDSETFRAYLDVQATFHRYSWANVALILAQRPDATQVAGYNAWLKMHRYVRRGEKGIKIVVPMTKKVEGEDGEPERKLIFGTGNVFDVSQTDGEPLPAVEVPVLTGQDGGELYGKLSEVAVREGLQVKPRSSLPGERMGYYDPQLREIVIREAAPLQMTKTLAHELGHHFAEHQQSDPESETSAEAIAYVVCSHFGLDTGERSFPYIATWAKERTVLKGALGLIQRTSSRIIEMIDGTREAAEPPLD
jgi:hypothetical protein